MASIDLRTIARSAVVTAGPDAPVLDLARTMADEPVGSVVIVDDANRPVGMVTDRDLTVDVLAAGADPDDLVASDVMTPDPVAVDIETGIFEVIAAMDDASVRRMPVVEDGVLAGIVTLDSLIPLITIEFDDMADLVSGRPPTFQRFS